MQKFIVLVLVGFLCVPRPASAQQPAVEAARAPAMPPALVVPASSSRLTVPGREVSRLVGRETLIRSLQPPAPASSSSGHPVLYCALIGAGTGALAFGLGVSCSSSAEDACGTHEKRGAAVIGAALGAGIGALVGLAFRH